MQRDEDETDVEAAYRHLSRAMHVQLAGKRPEWDDLRRLVVESYQKRASLSVAIADAEKALGIEPK
jgi:hypothetical protein